MSYECPVGDYIRDFGTVWSEVAIFEGPGLAQLTVTPVLSSSIPPQVVFHSSKERPSGSGRSYTNKIYTILVIYMLIHKYIK